MSPFEYLVLAALGLGALAIDAGTAEASMSNHTQGWGPPGRGPRDPAALVGVKGTWAASGRSTEPRLVGDRHGWLTA